MYPLSTLLDKLSHASSHLSIFHEALMMMLVFILSMVGGVLLLVIFSKNRERYTIESHRLETAWTVLPGALLMALALPSIRLLYAVDSDSKSPMTLKVTGHQWYWTYSYPALGCQNAQEFDSFMVPTEDLKIGQFRLLESSPRAVVPTNFPINVVVTSMDVIHSWAIPSLGVKLDAIPGRLNQTEVIINQPGVYYGQCSEICGANHSFMPITLEAVSQEKFAHWFAML